MLPALPVQVRARRVQGAACARLEERGARTHHLEQRVRRLLILRHHGLLLRMGVQGGL